MYFIIIAIVVALDQLTKYLIQANLELNGTIPLIDGIFHITYIHNSGAAFSLFQNKTEFLIAMQLAVIAVVMIYLVKRTEKRTLVPAVESVAHCGGRNGKPYRPCRKGVCRRFSGFPHLAYFQRSRHFRLRRVRPAGALHVFHRTETGQE